MRKVIGVICIIWLSLLLAGCRGMQSALDPAGREAERIAALFWLMTAGAAVIWLVMTGLALYAVRARPESLASAGQDFSFSGAARSFRQSC